MNVLEQLILLFLYIHLILAVTQHGSCSTITDHLLPLWFRSFTMWQKDLMSHARSMAIELSKAYDLVIQPSLEIL